MKQNVWLLLASQRYGEFYCFGCSVRFPIVVASKAKAIELSSRLSNHCPIGIVSIYRLPIQSPRNSVYVVLAETHGRYNCGCNCTVSDCGCKPCDGGRYALPYVFKSTVDAATYTTNLVAQHERCLIPVPKTKTLLLTVSV